MDEIDQRGSQMAEEGVEGSPLQDLLQERREKRQSLGIDTSPSPKPLPSYTTYAE
ncbi:hypothetical protein K1T71_013194, partial [Dendrolimus kikuchii]